MRPRDPDPELAHPEAAGWTLGILDGFDADRFAGHLRSCPDCQAAVAELGPAARMLRAAAPAEVPPPGLQARTLASVAAAATAAAAAAARQSEKHSRWRGLNVRMLALAAAVVIAAGVGVALALPRSPSAETYTMALHSPASHASGQAIAMHTDSGWSIQLTVAHLPSLGQGQFYECWWVGPGNRPGHPALVSAGTFVVGSSGTAAAHMWAAADPDDFKSMEITTETTANSSQPGQVVLSGTASD